MRTFISGLVFGWFILGCGGATTPAVDGGADDAALLDAATDATTPTVDGGAGDAAPLDAATDATDGDSAVSCPLPNEGVYATFVVADTTPEHTFRAVITNETGIDEAIALWRGTSIANIPNGELRCSPMTWNCPWNWHLDPATINFAELTTEVCDGLPRYIEDNCDTFVDRYCPWSAMLIELRDCRTDPTCPLVAR